MACENCGAPTGYVDGVSLERANESKREAMAQCAVLRVEIEKLTLQRDLAVKTLAEAKSNLMHHRRFGIDTLQAWKNSATRTEGDIEEALATIQELSCFARR